MKCFIGRLFAVLLLVAPFQKSEAAANPTVTVHLSDTNTSALLSGSIRGYETKDYIVHTAPGQQLAADLKSTSTSAFFNVLPPASDVALFIGSIGGSSWSGTIHDEGAYTIRVYLMRNAAKRDETADYTLRVKLSGRKADANLAPPKKFVTIKHSPFRATGSLPCRMGPDENRSTQCPFGVIRGKPGNAIVYITKPEGKKRILTFMDDNVTVEGNITLRSRKIDDMWYIDVNGKEHYLLPDLIITGD